MVGSPTEEDRVEVIRRFLGGVAGGDDAKQLMVNVGAFQVRHNTFPGEVLMKLSADALEIAGVDRRRRLDYQALVSTHLNEIKFAGKEQRRIQYAVLTAFAVHGGLEPDLLDEVVYWIERYWEYALLAAVAIFRACAEFSGMPLAGLATEVGLRHGVDVN